MSVRPPFSLSLGALAPPVAHLAGWFWIAYLLPVAIVLIPVVRNGLASRKRKQIPQPAVRKRRK